MVLLFSKGKTSNYSFIQNGQSNDDPKYILNGRLKKLVESNGPTVCLEYELDLSSTSGQAKINSINIANHFDGPQGFGKIESLIFDSLGRLEKTQYSQGLVTSCEEALKISPGKWETQKNTIYNLFR